MTGKWAVAYFKLSNNLFHIICFTFQNCLILKASGISTTHIRPKSKFYLFPVGLDSEKSIVSEKMQKSVKRGEKRQKDGEKTQT